MNMGIDGWDAQDPALSPPKSAGLLDDGDDPMEPEPVAEDSRWARALTTGFVVVLAGIGVLGVVSVTMGSTAGATRSAFLKWEAREGEIAAALADADIEQEIPGEPEVITEEEGGGGTVH